MNNCHTLEVLMTCIVMYKIDGHLFIGGDTAGIDPDNLKLVHISESKVFNVGDFLIGGTGSFRALQLLQYSFTPPRRKRGETTDAYMRSRVVDRIRSCLKLGGVAKIENEVEEGGDFLIGYEGRIFHLYTDFTVEETVDNYNACGSGAYFALGALKILENIDIPIKEKVKRALEVAEYFNAGVRSPFTFIEK